MTAWFSSLDLEAQEFWLQSRRILAHVGEGKGLLARTFGFSVREA